MLFLFTPVYYVVAAYQGIVEAVRTWLRAGTGPA